MTNDNYVINKHGAWSDPSDAVRWYEAEVNRQRALNQELLEALHFVLKDAEEQCGQLDLNTVEIVRAAKAKAEANQ